MGAGGSSRYITVAGLIIEKSNIKSFVRLVHNLFFKYNLDIGVEIKGAKFSNTQAESIIKDLNANPFLKFIAVTADKRNVNERLRRDKNIFYNYLLNNLTTDCLQRSDDLELILDDRTIRNGSRNSFEDCLRAKCWGELGLNTNISCRFVESHNNPGIWLADWLSNFVWRNYERNMSDAYLQCTNNTRFQEKKLFM